MGGTGAASPRPAGGEAVVAAGLLIASTLLTVLLAGPILRLLGAHSATSQLGLLATLTLVVALPLIAGCAMRTIDPCTQPDGADGARRIRGNYMEGGLQKQWRVR